MYDNVVQVPAQGLNFFPSLTRLKKSKVITENVEFTCLN